MVNTTVLSKLISYSEFQIRKMVEDGIIKGRKIKQNGDYRYYLPEIIAIFGIDTFSKEIKKEFA